MPPRLCTLAIVLAWLATTGVLVYRELGPRFRSGEAPPFTIDLTDEVRAEPVGWNVLQKGRRVGGGTTKVERQTDRTFKFTAEFNVDKFEFLVFTAVFNLNGAYVVTEEGRLKSGKAKLKVKEPAQVEIDFAGEVRGGQFHPKLTALYQGVDLKPPPLQPMPVSDSGSILNPMHLVHKISGLRDGRSWLISLADPLRAAPDAVRGLIPGNVSVVSHVVATVTVEDRDFHGEPTSCFKISYAKPEDRPLAATWVRRRDDLVLEQWASYEGIEYTLQRTRTP